MQVGMFGERLQDPILGSRSSAYRLGQIRSALTQLRNSDACAVAACTFTHGWVGGFLYLMALGIVGQNSELWG